jgi:hypothetical protein
MAECCRRPRLVFEPGHRSRVHAQVRGHHLDRDLAAEPGVVRQEHLAHAARTEPLHQFVAADALGPVGRVGRGP